MFHVQSYQILVLLQFQIRLVQADCIGGVILYDETINQLSIIEKRIPDLISDTGAVPGIKVDTGAKVLANSPEEKITEGLDGLRERLKEYYQLGARFTKWRGVYNIGEKYPSKRGERDPFGIGSRASERGI